MGDGASLIVGASVLGFLALVLLMAVVATIGPRIRAIFTPALRTAFLRILLGGVWAAAASLRFLPGGYPLLGYYYLEMVNDGQPGWMASWLSFWTGVVGAAPAFWWYGTTAVEIVIATCLLTGLLRRPLYLLGVGFSLFLWSVPGGLGGPYGPGTVDLGPGIINALLFIALLHLESTTGSPRLALDGLVGRYRPSWRRWVEPGGGAPLTSPSSIGDAEA